MKDIPLILPTDTMIMLEVEDQQDKVLSNPEMAALLSTLAKTLEKK